jgi:dimethylhistidine N-methyltransferase
MTRISSTPALNAVAMPGIIDGLLQPQKTLPCRYFYDARGSALFEKITPLPEYYATRTETKILTCCVEEIAAHTPPGSILVEFGSGSSRKSEILLAALPSLAAYVPIDVSPSVLDEACARLSARFAGLRLFPKVGDFTDSITWPAALAKRPRIGFFPGSTIGNFAPDQACDLLQAMARTLGPGARLVIGVDLVKDTARLVAAYDDAAGVTAEFNLNLLVRLNREMGATFDLTQFRHQAVYNTQLGRIEMYLVSRREQSVQIGSHRVHFAEGERIHTENSYKYTVAQFQSLAQRAGWQPRQVWTDAQLLFSVHELML